jgi:hypothetical protein
MKFRTLDHKKSLCFFDLGNLFAVTKKTSGSPFGLPSVVLDPQKRAPLGGFGPTKKVPRSKKQAFFMVSVRNYYSSRIYTFYPQFFSFSTQGPLIFDIWAPGFLFSIRLSGVWGLGSAMSYPVLREFLVSPLRRDVV